MIKNIFQFGLHDTEINSVECVNGKINFVFNDGVYFLNKDGKETEKTSKCMMSLKISGFDSNAACEHITVFRFKGKKFKEISFYDFYELVNANGFEIYLDYYCDFAKSLLLKGDIGKFGIEISFTEVDEIAYIFQ